MKISEKAWIFIGFFLVFIVLGYIIYDTTYIQKTTPKIYHTEFQFNIKDEFLVSFNCNYFAVLGDNPYQDKEMCIKLLFSEATHEILYDFYLEDYRQQKDEIIYDIKEAITAKVVQQFPNIEFQLIDIVIIVKL